MDTVYTSPTPFVMLQRFPFRWGALLSVLLDQPGQGYEQNWVTKQQTNSQAWPGAMQYRKPWLHTTQDPKDQYASICPTLHQFAFTELLWVIKKHYIIEFYNQARTQRLSCLLYPKSQHQTHPSFAAKRELIQYCEAVLILYSSEGVKVSIWCTEICLQDHFLPQGLSEEMG